MKILNCSFSEQTRIDVFEKYICQIKFDSIKISFIIETQNGLLVWLQGETKKDIKKYNELNPDQRKIITEFLYNHQFSKRKYP